MKADDLKAVADYGAMLAQQERERKARECPELRDAWAAYGRMLEAKRAEAAKTSKPK